jgi:hypothetical protein
MPNEVERYLDAYNEAQGHMTQIMVLSSALSNVAKVLAGPDAVYQTVPSSWPTAQQIADLLSIGRASLEKAKMLYSQLPSELKGHIPTPESISSSKPH